MSAAWFTLAGAATGGLVAAGGSVLTTFFTNRAGMLRVDRERLLQRQDTSTALRRSVYARFVAQSVEVWTLATSRRSGNDLDSKQLDAAFVPLYHLLAELDLTASSEIVTLATEFTELLRRALFRPVEELPDQVYATERFNLIDSMRRDLDTWAADSTRTEDSQ